MAAAKLSSSHRSVLECCRRVACRPSDAEAVKVCHMLALRGFVTRKAQPDTSGKIHYAYKATPAGIRALDGEPEKATKGEVRQKDWAKRTIADRKAGVKCSYPGCPNVATEGHHRSKRRTGDNSDANRVPLCATCHRLVESRPKLAFDLGLSVSSHTPIAPVEQHAPSQRGMQ